MGFSRGYAALLASLLSRTMPNQFFASQPCLPYQISPSTQVTVSQTAAWRYPARNVCGAHR